MGKESSSLSLSHSLIEDWQDTFRAEWAFLILFAPERVPGMVRSMLTDYKEVSFCPILTLFLI
jgi:putative alpha-1,2-mannosidase